MAKLFLYLIAISTGGKAVNWTCMMVAFMAAVAGEAPGSPLEYARVISGCIRYFH